MTHSLYLQREGTIGRQALDEVGGNQGQGTEEGGKTGREGGGWEIGSG